MCLYIYICRPALSCLACALLFGTFLPPQLRPIFSFCLSLSFSPTCVVWVASFRFVCSSCATVDLLFLRLPRSSLLCPLLYSLLVVYHWPFRYPHSRRCLLRACLHWSRHRVVSCFPLFIPFSCSQYFFSSCIAVVHSAGIFTYLFPFACLQLLCCTLPLVFHSLSQVKYLLYLCTPLSYTHAVKQNR